MMTDKTQALRDLLAKVDAGDRHGMNLIMAKIGQPSEAWPWDWMSRIDAAFNGSLDAAKALHDAVLPGWGWEIGRSGNGWNAKVWWNGEIGSWSEISPARAWLIAILRAMIAQAAP